MGVVLSLARGGVAWPFALGLKVLRAQGHSGLIVALLVLVGTVFFRGGSRVGGAL